MLCSILHLEINPSIIQPMKRQAKHSTPTSLSRALIHVLFLPSLKGVNVGFIVEHVAKLNSIKDTILVRNARINKFKAKKNSKHKAT